LISIEKTVKAIILIIVGLQLLTLFNHDVHAWAADFVTRHGIDIGNRFVHAALERLVGITNGQIVTFSVVAFLYSIVLLVEASGLWLQKRWAEYLTVISTSLLLPLEIYEIFERFTWVRIAILAINIFIVWYLATRLRDEKKEISDEPVTPRAPRVKICGITNLDDALHAIESGADELGFNFYKESPRYISPAEAKKIADKLPRRIIKIGVFVNESMEDVVQIAKLVGVNGIQLHGDESDLYILDLKEKTPCFVIKAFRVSPSFQAADALDWDMDYPLFDAYSPLEFGGTGQKLDWKNISNDLFVWFPNQAYLAGGLTSDNVAEAIQSVQLLYAVDVASGVESSPGKKDPEKVAAFIKAAKEAI